MWPSSAKLTLNRACAIAILLDIRMRIMCLTPSMWKDEMANVEASKHSQDHVCCPGSAYPVHGSASEVNWSGADVQVVSCYGYLVFHLFVEQLTVFYIPVLVLASSSFL